MRRALIVLTVVGGLLVAGVAIFIATFDVDRFRPQVIRQLGTALGRPVQLERLAMGWRHGLALHLRGLAIVDEPGGGEPLLALEEASAVVRLGPLLRRQLEISSVVLERPRLRVVRGPDGRLNLLGLAAAVGPAAAGAPAAPGPPGLAFRVESLRLHDGELHVTDANPQLPLDLWVRQLDVTVKHIAPGRPMDLTLSGALAAGRPNLLLKCWLTLPGAGVEGSVEQLAVSLEDFSIEQVLPPSPPGAPRIRGRLSFTMDGMLPTLAPDRMAGAAIGQGTLRVRELTVERLNLLRAVFEQLSVIPGLVQRLEERLPPEDRIQLTARDTIFAPVDVQLRVQQGVAQFDTVELRTDTFRLIGAGHARFNGAIQLQAVLRVAPGFSRAVIQSVEELRYLTNAQGELELPVRVRGSPATTLAVLPDLNYVASRVVTAKAKEVLGGFLERGLRELAPATQ